MKKKYANYSRDANGESGYEKNEKRVKKYYKIIAPSSRRRNSFVFTPAE